MTLAKGVLGAKHFLTELQALAKGRMNLSVWNGYNDLLKIMIEDFYGGILCI
jgi:hypothetical protein